MQILKITIVNEVNTYLENGSDVEMFIPIDQIKAIFKPEGDLPVVLVGNAQYRGIMELVTTPTIESLFTNTIFPHASEILAKAELQLAKDSDESQDIIPLLKAND
jgi:hypothetical protein